MSFWTCAKLLFFKTSYFKNEIELLQPHLTFLDPITLAFFEDTGWYKVDYSKADLYKWGKGRYTHALSFRFDWIFLLLVADTYTFAGEMICS